MKIKKKLRYLTDEEYKKWVNDNCYNTNCEDCPFKSVPCGKGGVKRWVLNKDMFSDKFLDQEIEIEIEKPKPTKEEIAFLKMLNPKWHWITKSDDIIEVHNNKPEKTIRDWISDEYLQIDEETFNLSFDFLSWEDDEPTNIQELIKDYENE